MLDQGDARTRLAVVSGGIGVPSTTRLLSDRLDAAVRSELTRAGASVTSTIVELRPLGRAIMDALLTGVATADLESAYETIATADGLIAVTPAFNASFSGLFKAFFDVVPPEAVADVPVLIAATGGTERHSLVLEHAMRPMFSYLHAIVSPTGVYAATDDFGSAGGPAQRARLPGRGRLRTTAALLRITFPPGALCRRPDGDGALAGCLGPRQR